MTTALLRPWRDRWNSTAQRSGLIARVQSCIDWPRGIVYGLLWGVAVTALESIGATVFMPSGTDMLRYAGSLLLLWSSRGVAMAWTAQLSEQWLRPHAAASLFALELVVLGLSWDGMTSLSLISERVYGLGLPPRANFLYNFWVLLVYGGPFFWLCMIVQHMRRARDVLARAEIERSRTDTMLAEAQLDALKGRVDPALLLRAMSTLREEYAHSRSRAEALLDATVSFLRRTMPGVRTGRSSVVAELALLRAYARLTEQLDPARKLCRIAAVQPPRDMPFPAMLLLPLVERLYLAQRVAVPVDIELSADVGGMKLCLNGRGVDRAWLTDDLAAGLRFTLTEWYGKEGGWSVGGWPSLTLWLPLPAGEAQEDVDES